MLDNISSLIEKYKEVEADMVVEDHIEETPYVTVQDLEDLQVRTDNFDEILCSNLDHLDNKSISKYILNYS
jgi:hypothetical protein